MSKAKIVTLTNSNGDPLYPITKIEQVVHKDINGNDKPIIEELIKKVFINEPINGSAPNGSIGANISSDNPIVNTGLLFPFDITTSKFITSKNNRYGIMYGMEYGCNIYKVSNLSPIPVSFIDVLSINNVVAATFNEDTTKIAIVEKLASSYNLKVFTINKITGLISILSNVYIPISIGFNIFGLRFDINDNLLILSIYPISYSTTHPCIDPHHQLYNDAPPPSYPHHHLYKYHSIAHKDPL